MRRAKLLPFLVFLLVLSAGPSARGEEPRLDLATFLNRLIAVDHLPEWTSGKTQMTSTWDRKGANHDGTDFKQIEGDRNVLLDTDGPGCVHRIFTGRLGKAVKGTRIRVLLDGSSTPVFDMEVDKFFDDKNGPFPYPLVFHKTYPGLLFPIPFAKHCRIELYHPEKKNWGNYWQVTYTRYPKGTAVKSLTWPLSESEKKLARQVAQAWLRAESKPPEPPQKWTLQKSITLKADHSEQDVFSDSGMIREIRLQVSPNTAKVLENVRMQLFWDGSPKAAVDMPIGYFFGNKSTGFSQSYHSLLMGVDKEKQFAYCRFPMPFEKGAVIRFENGSGEEVTLKLDVLVEHPEQDLAKLGRFHATLEETEIAQGTSNLDKLPRFGPRKVPVHRVIELNDCRGKYAGVFLHVDWPLEGWWGEGDWLIWTDENGWPPSYHGTGSEEYFNSGWCLFDNKAVSGIIKPPKMRPGPVGVYSYHLNDSFSFEKNARVAVEIMPWVSREKMPHSFWRSTAYWYKFPSSKD